MTTSATLSIQAGVEDLPQIRAFVRAQAQALGADPASLYDLLLAVTELVTNTIVHGYQAPRGWVAIVVESSGDAIVIRLRDRAPTFDPTLAPTPDIHQPLEKRPPGGMGIHLVRHMVNRLTHEALPTGGNQLTLVKSGILTNREESEYGDPS